MSKDIFKKQINNENEIKEFIRRVLVDQQYSFTFDINGKIAVFKTLTYELYKTFQTIISQHDVDEASLALYFYLDRYDSITWCKPTSINAFSEIVFTENIAMFTEKEKKILKEACSIFRQFIECVMNYLHSNKYYNDPWTCSAVDAHMGNYIDFKNITKEHPPSICKESLILKEMQHRKERDFITLLSNSGCTDKSFINRFKNITVDWIKSDDTVKESDKIKMQEVMQEYQAAKKRGIKWPLKT